MAFGDDYSEQTGRPDNTGDSDVQRKKSALELILRAQQKPSITPLQTDQGAGRGGRTSVLGNQPGRQPTEETAGTHRTSMFNPAGNDAPSLLKRPTTQGRATTGATPTNALGTSPQNPIGKQFTRPSTPRDVERFGGSDVSLDNDELVRRAGGMNESGATTTPRMPVLGASRPNIPSTRTADVAAPDLSATPPPSNGRRILGLGSTPVLGRGVQPARPDVQPLRSDFPERKLPGWEKALGIAVSPLVPALGAGILTGPRREAERQYESAAKDWTLGQEGAERQARTEEAQARTAAVRNPQPKEGVTGEEKTLHDLMTGGPNGGPKINPQTQKPYEYLEAYSAVQQAKTGAAQGAKQPPFDAATLSQLNEMHTQRYQQLNPNKPLPPALILRPGSTQADYERIDKNLGAMESAQGTQAQREATNTARTQAELDRQEARREKQSEADAQPVYAYDAKTKQTILTTAGEAKAANMPERRKVTEDNIKADKQQARQLADSQMNFSDYRMKLLQMQGLSGREIARVGDLIGDSKFRAHFLGLELPSDWANELRTNKDWTELPPDAQEAVEAYIGSRGAMIAYVRALNPGVRINDTMLNTEMKNLPSPTDPPSVQEGKFKRLQRNLDQASKGLVKMRDINTPAEVRQQMEVATPQASSPQPAQPAKKGPRQALADWLNRKMGAQ